MPKWIIAKFAKDHYPAGTAPSTASVKGTSCANDLGIDTLYYDSEQAAQGDVNRLNHHNPGGEYDAILAADAD